MIKNYYQILGLQSNCSKDDVKKAYRVYATKFHPDKQNNDHFFEERFKEIKEAYDILIDDNSRTQYDSKFNSSNHHSSNKNKFNSVDDILNENIRIENEKRQKEKFKRSNIYYTSKDLVLNGLYVNCLGRSYELSEYDGSTIRPDDNSSFITLGIILIIVGVLTMAFLIGIFLFLLGIYSLFYKEYFIVLISKKGDIPLIKGRKSKMEKISKLINNAIEQNK